MAMGDGASICTIMWIMSPHCESWVNIDNCMKSGIFSLFMQFGPQRPVTIITDSTRK